MFALNDTANRANGHAIPFGMPSHVIGLLVQENI